RSWLFSMVAQLLVLLSCLTRYAYYPIVAVIPLVLLMQAWSHPARRKSLVVSAVSSGVGGLGGILALSAMQTTYLGAYYPEWSYHPEYLLRMNPILASALGFWQVLGKAYFKAPELKAVCFAVGHLVSFALAAWACYRAFCFFRFDWKFRMNAWPGT